MADLIDRDEAISALVTIDTTRYCVPCKEVLKAIRELPSVEAQIIACGEDEATDLSNYLDTLWHLAYERGKAEAEQQIIRCKDCKHRPVVEEGYDEEEWDSGFCLDFPDTVCPCGCDDYFYNWLPKDDFYCGFAERMEGTDG